MVCMIPIWHMGIVAISICTYAFDINLQPTLKKMVKVRYVHNKYVFEVEVYKKWQKNLILSQICHHKMVGVRLKCFEK